MSERAPEPVDDQGRPPTPDRDLAQAEGAAALAHARVRRSRTRTGLLASGRTVTALVSTAVLAVGAYGWYTFGDVNDNVATTDVIDLPGDTGPHSVPLDGAVDILLVGMDSRTDAFGNPLPDKELAELHGGVSDGERNTDTMILVHIPVDGTRATAISFPRDSWVQQAGPYGKHKLNSAFVYAYTDARQTLANKGITDEKELDRQATVAGRKNLIATIEKLTGGAVSIDRYAEVNLASFYEISKAVGGVQVCLNKAVDDPKSGAHFKAGVQTVSGAAALSFVRQRYGLPGGDFDRIVRQQVFLGALATKVLSADMLTDPAAVRTLLDAVKKSVVLSSNWDLLTFAQQMQGLVSGNIQFRTIPTEGEAKIGGADVIEVDPDKVKAFVTALTTDERTAPQGTGGSSGAPPPSTTNSTSGSLVPGETSTSGGSTGVTTAVGEIVVDVRNGTHQHGLATQLSQSLATLGFQQGSVGDAPLRASTAVLYPPGEQAAAQQVVTQLGGTVTTEADQSVPDGHVRVVLGTDRELNRSQFGGAHQGPPDGTGTTTSSSSPADPTRGTDTPGSGPVIRAGGTTCVN